MADSIADLLQEAARLHRDGALDEAVGRYRQVLRSEPAHAQAPEKRKVNIATASLGLPYLPLIIAQQRKYFAEEGLEVEIAAFAGGSKALQSLMGGSSDELNALQSLSFDR